MKYRPYPEYRDAGFAWLGRVPAHWKVLKLKHIASSAFSSVDKHSVEGERPVRLCNYVDVYYNEAITDAIKFMDATASPEEVAQFSLRKGDVMITKDSESWDDIAVAAHVEDELDGVLCGYHLALVRPDTGRVEGRFLYRAFGARGINDQFRVGATGITRYGLGKYALDVGVFPLPPFDEQQAISTVLERETAKVDSLVAKKERLVELLQEKRTAMISRAVTAGLDRSVSVKASGIEGLGLIPGHWQLRRLKQVAEVRQGVTKGRDLQGRATIERPYLRVANVQAGRLDLADVHSIEVGRDEVSRYELQVGDVLMNEGGDNDKLGRGAVWEGQIPGCLHQNHVFAVRPRDPSMSRWIAMVTLTEYARFFFLGRAKQSTNLASISSTNLQELPVLIPPPSERAAILKAVNQQGQAVDALVGQVREAIERLKEYRTALVSAAVTGQIDVRAEAERP